MPKPPVDPDFFDKVNYVIDAWSDPCDAPWYIYIETMLPAALEAFITLITFGWDDVARGYFRPRGLNLRRSGKRKGKWAKRRPRFPELGEELGKRLPGADKMKDRKWSSMGKTLWRIDTVAQRALFWWLVADVTNDFAFNWTSLLYETHWCRDPDLGRFSYHSDGFTNIPVDHWWTATFEVEDYEEAPPAWGFNRGFSGPNGCTVVAAAAVGKHPLFDPPTSLSIRISIDGFSAFDLKSGPNDTNPDGSLDIALKGEVPPNVFFRVQGFVTGDQWAVWGDKVVAAVESET